MKESILVIAVIVLVSTAAYFFSEEAQDKAWLDEALNVSVQEYSRLWQEIYELQEQMEQLRCEIKDGTYDFRPSEEGIIFFGKQCKVGGKYYNYENGEFVREESL